MATFDTLASSPMMFLISTACRAGKRVSDNVPLVTGVKGCGHLPTVAVNSDSY